MSDEPTAKVYVSAASLIPEVMTRRTQKLINAYVLLNQAWRFGKAIQKKRTNAATYKVTIAGNDPLYGAVQDWFVSYLDPARQKSLEVSSRFARSVAIGDDTPDEPARLNLHYEGSVRQKVVLDGHTVEAWLEKPQVTYSGGRQMEYDSFYSAERKLMFESTNVAGRDAVIRLLNQLSQEAASTPVMPRLHIATSWGHWDQRDFLRPRRVDTVVLAEGLAEEIFADLDEFLKSEEQHEILGLPWHRGYLFHGPPGSGKTSIAQAMASAFNMSVFLLPLSVVEDDAALFRLFAEVKGRGLLIVEDIDVVHAAQERELHDEDSDEPRKGATLSGLLNAMDGMITPHGLITVLTTNRLEILDDALIRAGRIDMRVAIEALTKPDLQRLIKLFTGEGLYDVEIPDDFTAVPSDIVQLVKRHIHDPKAARHAIAMWINDQAVTT